MLFVALTHHTFLFGVLLVLFVIKGFFLVLLFPFFQQPDEQIHYATVQHWAEPTIKNWKIDQQGKVINNDLSDISTYRLTEETIQVAEKTQFDEIKFQKENTQHFSNNSAGPFESEILTNNWNSYVEFESNNVSGTWSTYYWIGAHIERLLSEQNLLLRFYSSRSVSIAIGSLIVLLSYCIARKAGLSSFGSLGLAGMVAFQPMFAATAAQVNIDIALIFSFSLYTLAATLLLKHGINWKFSLLLLLSILLGLASKGPGLVLVGVSLPLFLYLTYQKLQIGLQKFSFIVALVGLASIICAALFIPASYFASITHLSTSSMFPSVADSLLQYTEKAHTVAYFFDMHASYWGNFGWLDTRLNVHLLSFIAALELIGVFGLLWYLLGKEVRPWLLEKKYLWFFLTLSLSLQLAIRFFDWRMFDMTGTIIISPMGRYYLPNIIPHLLLVINGLGFFMKNRRQFERLILWLSIGMVLLSLYSIFFVIIPRYYL